MKFVCDFDGVLTDLSQEAARVREIFTQELGKLAGLGVSQRARLLEMAEQAMNESPQNYGWYSSGRISAYCNEDGFIRTNALGALLDGWAKDLSHPTESAAIAQKLKDAGTASFTDLAQAAYLQMVKETAAGERHPLDERTRPVLETLLHRGHRVVIVSNSGTDRILQMFAEAGLKASAEAEAPLRVRGNAQKFVLGTTPKTFNVGPYRVDVDRPGYEKILLEEKPDFVVGDVFSLDLALPMALARDGKLKGLKGILRNRPYTPGWSLDHLTRGEGQGGYSGVINGLDGLLGLDK